MLLDREGRLVHIDFGFVLGRAPGGSVALEASVPFKLTREMVDVLGGPTAPLFTETFVELCTAALQAVREHADTLFGLTEVSGRPLPTYSLPSLQSPTPNGLPPRPSPPRSLRWRRRR